MSDKKYCPQKIVVYGKHLNYVKIGQGEPLILIHGWANNWQGWMPIVPYLNDYFSLYLLDLPGFGDSSDLENYSVEIDAKFVAGFLKKINLKAHAVIGLSMGSFVVAEVVKSFPGVTRSGVLISPVIVIDDRRILKNLLRSFLRLIRRSEISESLLKKIVETRTLAYMIAKYLNMYRFNKRLVDLYGMIGKKKMRKEAFVEMGISAASYKIEKSVKSISLPTLLIYGREDRVTSSKYAKEHLLKVNRQLKLAVISEAGHVVPWEQPKAVAEVIRKFIHCS